MNTIAGEIKEIYKSRNFLKALVYKNLFGRYKNSIFGFAWHFFTPLVMMIVYYLAFSYNKVTDIPDNWLFVASGLFVFHFILHNIIAGSGAVVNQGEMVKKMYFPRALLPLSYVISTFIISLIGYAIVFLGILIFGHDMNFTALLFFPVAMILALLFATGCVLLTSAVTVYVRDLHYMLTSVSMVFYFMTPMYFIARETTGTFAIVIWSNPLTYFVEMCHDTIYWGLIPETSVMLTATIMSFVMLIVGIVVFHRLKGNFAERL